MANQVIDSVVHQWTRSQATRTCPARSTMTARFAYVDSAWPTATPESLTDHSLRPAPQGRPLPIAQDGLLTVLTTVGPTTTFTIGLRQGRRHANERRLTGRSDALMSRNVHTLD